MLQIGPEIASNYYQTSVNVSFVEMSAVMF